MRCQVQLSPFVVVNCRAECAYPAPGSIDEAQLAELVSVECTLSELPAVEEVTVLQVCMQQTELIVLLDEC